MNTADLRLMFEYNEWANNQILSAAEQVSAEQLKQPTSFSWGSLHGTLVHLMDTEYGWRCFVQQGEITPDLNPADFPDLASVRARWDVETAAMWSYLDSLTDNDLQGVIRYEVEGKTRERVLWHCLWHVVNHGMQHRSECAAMLTDFGQSPGGLDFTRYLNER